MFVVQVGNFADLLAMSTVWGLNHAFYYDNADTSDWTVAAVYAANGSVNIMVWATGTDPLPHGIPAGWEKLTAPFTVNANGDIITSA